MLIYLIDAFNLIHAVPELTDSAAPRADLIAYLKAAKLTGSRTNRTVIVYDGYPAEGVDQEREYEVMFSKARTADDVIKEFVAKAPHKRQIVVVSDDRAVRDSIRAEGARPMANAEFLQRARKRSAPARRDHGESEKQIENAEEITEELEKIWVKK